MKQKKIGIVFAFFFTISLSLFFKIFSNSNLSQKKTVAPLQEVTSDNQLNKKRTENKKMGLQGITTESKLKEAQNILKREEEVDITSVAIDFDEKDFEKKRKKNAKKLVEDGIRHIQKNEIHKAFNDFTHNKEFLRGDLYLFVYNTEGICFAHGQKDYLLLQNLYNLQDVYGVHIVQEIINAGKKGSGWVTYAWRNATKIAYVSKVKKDGVVYIVGSGYYPHSKRDSVVNLVNGAIDHFYDILDQGGTVKDAFSTFSYPLGKFVLGDLYLYALDFDGIVMAHGERPGLIGQNALEYKTVEGDFLNKNIMAKLSSLPSAWIEYISKGARKLAYVKKITDKTGKHYFVGCGYYPDAGRKAVQDLVAKGFKYMQLHGITQSTNAFNNPLNAKFFNGDLSLFIYTMKGKVIAYGENKDFVGVNQYNLKDDSGQLFVQNMIQKAKKGGGWVDIKLKNAFHFIYLERVRLGTQDYFVGSGFYPISKPETAQLLVKRAIEMVRDNDMARAQNLLIKRDGNFVSGDLNVMLFDSTGICYAYGDDSHYIWTNMMNEKDDDGRFFVKMFIDTARRGPGSVIYKENGAFKIAYVHQLKKDGQTFVVASSFYK